MTRALAVATVVALAVGSPVLAQVPSDQPLSVAQVFGLASKYDDWDAWYVTKIVLCESGNHPLVVNPAGPYIGLGQIWAAHVAFPEWLYDPVYNIEVMHTLWQRYGYSQWPVCSRLAA